MLTLPFYAIPVTLHIEIHGCSTAARNKIVLALSIGSAYHEPLQRYLARQPALRNEPPRSPAG
ncbi:hypothetical protein [Thermogemmatispora sp.]|uniref:hypothetical protein n=1 Tax=Thermogemmatispora sp. TaxID=1968838 RepID=UPI002ACC1FD7|nr:hypothetical protein [Thermogemmatispora sp.]